MIHSNTPPAHVQGRPWWKIKRLAAMVPDPPVHAGSRARSPGLAHGGRHPKRECRPPARPVRRSCRTLTTASSRCSLLKARWRDGPHPYRPRQVGRRTPRPAHRTVRADDHQPGLVRLPRHRPQVPPLLATEPAAPRPPRRRRTRRWLPQLATHPRPGRRHLPGREGIGRAEDPRPDSKPRPSTSTRRPERRPPSTAFAVSERSRSSTKANSSLRPTSATPSCPNCSPARTAGNTCGRP